MESQVIDKVDVPNGTTPVVTAAQNFEPGEACSGLYNCEVRKRCLYGCKN